MVLIRIFMDLLKIPGILVFWLLFTIHAYRDAKRNGLPKSEDMINGLKHYFDVNQAHINGISILVWVLMICIIIL